LYDIGDSANDNGIYFSSSMHTKVEDCVFDNCYGAGIIVSDSEVMIDGCTFDGDGDAAIGGAAFSTDYGLKMLSGMVYIKNSLFGSDPNGDHDLADIYMFTSSLVHGRNVKLDSATEISWAYTLETGSVNLEDDEQTHLAYKTHWFHGTRERSVAVERSGAGGTAWSILGTPNAQCDTGRPLYIIGDWLRGMPIYLDGTAQTITVYAYADSTGDTWTPNASEFYIEVEHYEGAGDWEVDVSSDTFADEDQWETLSITLTPGAAGPAYLRAVLVDQVAGAKIYLDPLPDIQ
jgi:parallel beta-helix repeat protein